MMFLLLSCGAGLESRKNIATSNLNDLVGETVEGSINLADGGMFNLREDLSKETLVLIFAQDTCSKCSKEAMEIAQRIDEIGSLPANVEIVTYMTGLTPEYALDDANDWIVAHSVDWKVGFEKDGDDLFRKYFSLNPTVPSVIIQKHGRIIFAHTGELRQERMEEITGEWK